MRQIAGISQLNAVNTAFLKLTHRGQIKLTLWDWRVRAWRAAHPTVDSTVYGDHMKWTDLKQAINITRKLVIFSLVYDRTGIICLCRYEQHRA